MNGRRAKKKSSQSQPNTYVLLLQVPLNAASQKINKTGEKRNNFAHSLVRCYRCVYVVSTTIFFILICAFAPDFVLIETNVFFLERDRVYLPVFATHICAETSTAIMAASSERRQVRAIFNNYYYFAFNYMDSTRWHHCLIRHLSLRLVDCGRGSLVIANFYRAIHFIWECYESNYD